MSHRRRKQGNHHTHARKDASPATLKKLNRPLVRCQCGKVFNPTLEDARRVQHTVEKLKGRQNPVRFYQCRHGGFHWTQQLHEVTLCVNCDGRFRPRNDQPAGTNICDTCDTLLKDQAMRRISAVGRAQEMQARRRMQETARIIATHQPTPNMFARRTA